MSDESPEQEYMQAVVQAEVPRRDQSPSSGVLAEYAQAVVTEEDVHQSPIAPPVAESFPAKWTRTVGATHRPILKAIHAISGMSARHPTKTCWGVVLVSVALVAVGWLTNFNVDVDERTLWTPQQSKPIRHRRWIENESGFPADKREMFLFFHAHSGNVLGQDPVRRVFSVVDGIRNLTEYSSVCAGDSSSGGGGDEAAAAAAASCKITGVVDFWNESSAVFEAQVSSDDDAIQALSALTYPDGRPVPKEGVFGYPVRNEDTGVLLSAQSYTVIIYLPDTDEAESFEKDALDVVFDLNDAWAKQAGSDSAASPSNHHFSVEVFADRSFSDEFERGIVSDLPLVPMVFIVMSLFTCAVFTRCHKVQSRSLLGFGAVVSVLLSLMSGYGFCFCIGIPFTAMTQILPFVIFGIGLDDTYVLFGAYGRTTGSDPIERISETIDEIGVSISLTTMTSALAFGLGSISTIPAIRWLCLYAFPTIIIVFVYQLTFFVACIVVDERRIQEHRRDCCTCLSVEREAEGGAEDVEDSSVQSKHKNRVDRFMGWYGKQLLRPCVKTPVIILFAAMLGGFSYSASKLRQDFQFTDVVPDDSYIRSFVEALETYTDQPPIIPYAYFRFVDQSDPFVQEQMEQYIEDLVTIDAIEVGPQFFWLRDFKTFVNDNPGLEYHSFNGQILAFLSDPVYHGLYHEHLVLDSLGYIDSSRVMLRMKNIEIENVRLAIAALEDQRAVTAAQPINAGRKNWAFFTYTGNYNIWEFYSVSVNELILTTVIGVVAVTGVALIFVPHWSAALFVLPIISILYVDLLGFIQWMGASVNPVSYIALVMSIGLLVDFILHVLVRFFETTGSREGRTIATLSSMGSSILLGAISTFLGLMPLALSSSEIFRTVFVAFFGLVVLGASHGLVLLPVILSMIGPEDPNDPSHGGDDDGTG